MILRNTMLNRHYILLFSILLSCEKENSVDKVIISESKKIIENTSGIKSKNIVYVYEQFDGSDSIIGLTYDLPIYVQNTYYLKIINDRPMLIEKGIYKKYFEHYSLKVCNNPQFFRSKDYFPNIVEPYYVNLFISNNRVIKIERQNIPEE